MPAADQRIADGMDFCVFIAFSSLLKLAARFSQ
jgi:hypothetical protein